MKATHKKCPMCAEAIPLAAVNCEYCGAQFEVTSTGYCPNCHQVREADPKGCCKVCNGEIIDRRVESRLIEEPGHQHPQPIEASTPAVRSIQKSKTWMAALIAIVVLGLIAIGILALIALFFVYGPRLTSAVVPSTSTPLTVPTTLRNPPTSTPTRTPRPTATATPMPAWVSDFAEPILSVIESRPPTLQDDLNDNSGGWQCKQWSNNPSMKLVEGELVLDTCAASRSNMAFTDFVLELDERFLPGASQAEEFRIFFRDQEDFLTYKFFVRYDGSLFMLLPPYDQSKIEITSDSVHSGYVSNHIVVIAKGPSFAFYVNGQPVYYLEDTTIWQRGSISFETYSHVALDNLKIWDISDISIP